MPSLAILSRLGVRPAIKPRLYAPMFHIPMSSPMMTRMVGFLSCAWAAVTMNATHRATAHCFSIFGFGFIVAFVYRIDVCVLDCGGMVGLIGDSGNLSVVWL